MMLSPRQIQCELQRTLLRANKLREMAAKCREVEAVRSRPESGRSRRSDAHGNPSETFDAERYGKVMAEREMIRRGGRVEARPLPRRNVAGFAGAC
jgi:hypothetical protein